MFVIKKLSDKQKALMLISLAPLLIFYIVTKDNPPEPKYISDLSLEAYEKIQKAAEEVPELKPIIANALQDNILEAKEYISIMHNLKKIKKQKIRQKLAN